MRDVSTPCLRKSAMAASAIGFCCGRTVTNETGRPKPARDTATLASPPPNVATSSGVWNKRSEPRADNLNMISPKVIVVFDIFSLFRPIGLTLASPVLLFAPGLVDLCKKFSRRCRDAAVISHFRARRQVTADTQRNAAGANPVRRVVYRHTSCWHQGSMWQRSKDRFHECRSQHLAREEFHDIRSFLQSAHDLSGRGCPRHRRNLIT